MVVRCFGSFEVSVGGVRRSGPPLSQNKAGRALRLLIHRRGQKVARDELAEVLWPDAEPDAARASLKVMIHSLRHALEPDLGPRQTSRFIDYESDSYRFMASTDIWVDVDAFLAKAAERQRQEGRGASGETQARYEEAVDLYRGDYLGEDLYEDWCAGERQRLLEMYLSVLTSLAAVHASQRNYAAAVDCCWRAVARDGCRESSYRLLMDYLWRDGRPHEALRVYDRCRTVLERDLGLPPLPETTDLYRRVTTEIS